MKFIFIGAFFKIFYVLLQYLNDQID